MSSWMNDAAAVQNHNGAGFNHLNDPNAGGNMLDPSTFMQNQGSFDPSQFQNQAMQQRMQNGAMRNSSPGFNNNPSYQTNPLIPSKRPRGREDSMGESPRQGPGMLPGSRSQTPQQAFNPGFQPGAHPQQHGSQQPTPYSHLQQNGSANASPSPVMGMRPGVVPQRVSTASPHPFSPAAQQFSAQASPPQSDHGSRVDTPSNPYMQNGGFQPGFNQNFTPPNGRPQQPLPNPQQPGMSTPGMHMPNAQMQHPQLVQQQAQQRTLDQQKMMYQMRLQQQMQQGNLMQQGRMPNMPQTPNQMGRPPMQMQAPNGQVPPGMRPQQGSSRPQQSTEQFLKSLTAFMKTRNMPLDMNPMVGDRTFNIVMLYMAVSKFGGYQKACQMNGWSQIAQALQFSPIQYPSAPIQLKQHYEKNLVMFEEAWTQQQRQRAMMQQGQQGQPGNPMPGQPQMSPTKQMNFPGGMPQQSPQFKPPQQPQPQPMGQPHPQFQQPGPNTPVKQMAPVHPGQPPINGYSTPQGPQQTPQHLAQSHRGSIPRNLDLTPAPNGTSFSAPSPASVGKPGSISMPVKLEPDLEAKEDVRFILGPTFKPNTRALESTYGGIEVDKLKDLGDEIEQFRPDVPMVHDMGIIDIHALNMSLQSGIHSEVRLALDTLVMLSVEARLQLDLRGCEDLVESLIDCAEIQVDALAENSPEVSDDMLIIPYEDIVRGCRLEQSELQDIPDFGTPDYELDRAVDRLVCVTTILRNLSFFEANQQLLADELVIKFMCVIVRYLGTRHMLLRTHMNTLDFMKDIIIFLSNVAQAIELPGREQALCLLHFLLAFAPSPPPNASGTGLVTFAPYDVKIHRYLPSAVDGLAKLLARDEPNRSFYKAIFAAEVASTPAYDLLTRAFALTVSPLPEHQVTPGKLMIVVEHRKPVLMQAMLAAEILSNLAPSYEYGLARSWLTSGDGFAHNLLQLVETLCGTVSSGRPNNSRQAASRQQQPDLDRAALETIAHRGLNILRKLTEKTQNPDSSESTIPADILPSKSNLLGAMMMKDLEGLILKQFCAFAALDI